MGDGETPGSERRTSPRDAVFYRTTARLADGATIALDIVNISATGLMGRTPAELEADTRLDIALPQGAGRLARVAWVMGGRIGAEFLTPIEAQDYAGLLAQMPRGD
ncbi:MAG TPA: PilZ domain-containing protein [Sphingomonadaceae bacterium]|nr:PilZ domain-containing protein [Sphingomonadaceae bacterium]